MNELMRRRLLMIKQAQPSQVRIAVTKTYGQMTTDEAEITQTYSGRGGSFQDFVMELISEIVPIVAAELSEAGHNDSQLAKRIAKRVVLQQLDVTDPDESV